MKAKMDLDKILEGTGFSSKTKALRFYAGSGIKSKIIAASYDAACAVQVLSEQIMAVALCIANRHYNGGYNLFPFREFPFGAEDEADITAISGVGVDLQSYKKLADSLRIDTVVAWQNAYKKIDVFIGR